MMPDVAPSTSALLATTTVRYPTLSGSPSSLVVSADGQYAIVGMDELHLLTPDLLPPTTSEPPVTSKAKGKGKAKDQNQQSSSDRSQSRRTSGYKFSKTSIKVEKKNLIKWGDWVDDIESVAVGSVDVSWRSASFSPSGVSQLGSCAVATLTTNAEVLIYEPIKNAASGEWEETFDATSHLLETVVNPSLPKGIEQTSSMRQRTVSLLMQAQCSSIAWSPPLSTSNRDSSLFAIGHRSGHISFWRYDREDSTCLLRIRPGENVSWITMMTWSEWRTDSNGSYAHLAIGDADGRIWIVTISQKSLEDELIVESSEEGIVEIAKKDRRPVTQFCWLPGNDSNESRKLAYTKLGTVTIVSLTSNDATLSLSGSHDVELAMEDPETSKPIWAGASNWSECSGLIYSAKANSLTIQLTSALLYSLPVSNPPPSTLAPSQSLSRAARDIYVSILTAHRANKTANRHKGDDTGDWKKPVSWKEGARVSGIVQLPGGVNGSEYGFIFETERPDYINYQPPTNIKTTFAFASLAGLPSEQGIVDKVAEVFGSDTNSNSLYEAPRLRLISLLDSFSQYSSSETFVSSLLSQLSTSSSSSTSSHTTHEGQQKTLSEVLFGDPKVELSRKRLAVAERLSMYDDLPHELEDHVDAVVLSLSRNLIREVITRIASVLSHTPDLSDSEKSLQARLLLASSALPAFDADSIASNPSLDDQPDFIDTYDPEQLATAFESNLSCPACQSPVPLANVRKATCSKGHRWERCSITLSIISSVDVRTCSSCQRKSHVTAPHSQEKTDGTVEDGGKEMERVDEMLREAKCCVYCGGRWMKVR